MFLKLEEPVLLLAMEDNASTWLCFLLFLMPCRELFENFKVVFFIDSVRIIPQHAKMTISFLPLPFENEPNPLLFSGIQKQL